MAAVPQIAPPTSPRQASPGGHGNFLAGVALVFLAQSPVLWPHRSDTPVVLGRYSAAYALGLVAHTALVAAIGTLSLRPALLAAPGPERALSALRRILESTPALGAALVLPWAAAAAAAAWLRDGAFGRSWILNLTLPALAFWVSLWLLLQARPRPHARARALAKYGSLLVSANLALVILEVGLRANPGLLPPAFLQTLPEKGDVFFNHFQYDDEITVGYRYRPRLELSQELRLSHTYEYEAYSGLVPPLPAGGDRTLSKASFVTDSLGYRNREPLLSHYPIVVSGDSFTSHAVEPDPWPSHISASLGVPVLNLGLQGYGPQNQVEAILRFGLCRRPGMVVVGFYEGNDIWDAEGYERRKRSGGGWRFSSKSRLPIADRIVSIHLLRYAVQEALDAAAGGGASGAGDYPYPFEVELGGRNVQLGFAGAYLSLHSVSRQELSRLAGLTATLDAYARLAAACRAAGARLVIAYFPTKEHCYIPLLPPAVVGAKLGRAVHPEITAGGELDPAPEQSRPLELDALLANVDAQRQTVLEAVAKLGIETIDLTPALQEAARSGTQVYWGLDNHWAPAGQEIVAAEIARRLAAGR